MTTCNFPTVGVFVLVPHGKGDGGDNHIAAFIDIGDSINPKANDLLLGAIP